MVATVGVQAPLAELEQLATADRRGFVLRIMAGSLGALGILVLASVAALVVP